MKDYILFHKKRHPEEMSTLARMAVSQSIPPAVSQLATSIFSGDEFLELDEGEQEDLDLLAKHLAAYLRLDGLPEKERLEIFHSPLLAEDLVVSAERRKRAPRR